MDFTSLIYSATLLVAGYAASYVQRRQILRPNTPIPVLYFVSIICFVTFCYISIWYSVVAGDHAAAQALLTIQYIADATTAVCLEACYILRLRACLKMYPHRNWSLLLFVFPSAYVLNDLFAIIDQYTDNAVNIGSVGYGMFNMTLIVGGIISHLSAVVILLTNAKSLKDEHERRNLQLVAAAAFLNQTLYFIFCLVSFWEITYSVAVLYLIWAVDHIIFTKVNQHIRRFLLSNHHSDSGESSGNNHDHRKSSSRMSSAPNSPKELESFRSTTTTSGDEGYGRAHERTGAQTETV